MLSVAVLLLLLLRRYSPARRGWMQDRMRNQGATTGTLPAIGYVDLLDRHAATAVFLVGTRNDPGPRMIDAFAMQGATRYRQLLFLAVGAIDSGEEAVEVRKHVRSVLGPYLAAARGRGYRADCRISFAPDPGAEIGRLCDGVFRTYPRLMFFIGDPVCEHLGSCCCAREPGIADGLRGFLERRGIPVKVLSVGEHRRPGTPALRD
jgi:hypothetical protein